MARRARVPSRPVQRAEPAATRSPSRLTSRIASSALAGLCAGAGAEQRHGEHRRRWRIRGQIRAACQVGAVRAAVAVVVVPADVEMGRELPGLVAGPHQVVREVGDVAGEVMVRGARRHHPEPVEEVVQHRVLPVGRRRGGGREAVQLAHDARRPAAQVHHDCVAVQLRRPEGAAAGVGARAVVVDGIDAVAPVEACSAQLRLDRFAHERTTGGNGGVGRRKPEEADVERALIGVEAKVRAAGLRGQPALEGADGAFERACLVEPPVDAVRRHGVDDMDLRALTSSRRSTAERGSAASAGAAKAPAQTSATRPRRMPGVYAGWRPATFERR